MATETTRNSNSHANGRRSAAVIVDLMRNLAFPIAVICGGALISHEVRLATISDSRFTDLDGMLLERQLRTLVDQKVESLTTILGTGLAELPPKWLLESVTKLEARLHALEARETRK